MKIFIDRGIWDVVVNGPYVPEYVVNDDLVEKL